MLDSLALSLTFIIRNKEEEQENLSFLGGKTLVLLSALPLDPCHASPWTSWHLASALLPPLP